MIVAHPSGHVHRVKNQARPVDSDEDMDKTPRATKTVQGLRKKSRSYFGAINPLASKCTPRTYFSEEIR